MNVPELSGQIEDSKDLHVFTLALAEPVRQKVYINTCRSLVKLPTETLCKSCSEPVS